MEMLLKCEACGVIDEYWVVSVPISCINCSEPIHVYTEELVLQNKIDQQKKPESVFPVLEIGTIVIVDNREHVWDGEIALVCEVQNKRYRLELLGKKIWVPEHWVKIHEPTNTNEGDWS